MSRDDPQFNLRVPADLKGRLERAAAASKRSMTAEVLARLEESFDNSAGSEKAAPIDTKTMDLFADDVAGRVVKALDEREKKRKKV
ncbi:uncharacterized protein (DUF1778 family) [Caballeronia udeis]|uniref:Uncharacterized protein (DUF1778 family) n=1 Tax=Caballeronia udeis TaxID=1232866 RepID=A0ABW8MGQ5_9BURK